MTLGTYALGPFHVARNGVVIPDVAWKTQKNKALLKILLTYRGHSVTKDQFIEWLWSERDPASAGRDLRVAVSHLRGLLEPDLPHGSQSTYILTTEAGYMWNSSADYLLDAEEFERLSYTLLHETDGVSTQQIMAQAENALSLYRGDYLEEDRYADWPISERERLREIYFGLLTTLAEAYARQGRYGRATALCRRVLSGDGCRENVWCQLMLYYYHAGDQAQALRAYEECRQALAKELGIEPLPETTTLATHIRERTVTRDRDPEYPKPSGIERLRQLPVSLGRTPLVGREREYTLLRQHLELARNGQGRVVLVEGEAGIGKSRLADEVLSHARNQGALVIVGYCRESAGEPYQPIVEALRHVFDTRRQVFDGLAPAWLTSIADLLPEIRQAFPGLPPAQPLPPEQERARLFDALAHTLLTIPGEGGLLCLAIDDIHWIDPATLDFLGHFASYVGSSSTMVLCVLRSEEASGTEADAVADWLWEVRKRGMLHRVPLQPLLVEDVALLVDKLSGSKEQSDALAKRLYAETDGNPLFLLSVLQSLFEEGFVVMGENGGWVDDLKTLPEPGATSLQPTVQQVILHRLRRLGSGERETLEAAAVLGRGFEWSVLHRMRSWRRDVLFDNLDRLKETLLVRQHGPESYSFSHDKVRQAVYDDTTPATRAWLHGKAGESLEVAYAERLDVAASAIAMHFERAGRADRAFMYHLRAGAYAMRLYANSEAVSHFDAALALVERGGFQASAEALREAHEQLGNLHQVAGQYAQAEKHLLAALEHAATPVARATLLYKVAHNYDRQGQRPKAAYFLSQAVAEVESVPRVPGAAYRVSGNNLEPEIQNSEHDSGLEAAKIYARWAILRFGVHGSEKAENYAREAVAMLGDHLTNALHGPGPLSWAEYDTIHAVLTNAGETFREWKHWREAKELFEQALIVAERQGELIGIGYSCHNLGDVLLAEAKFEAARASYSKAIEAFAQTRQAWEEMASLTHLGLAWACEGRWAEAANWLQRACAVGENMEPTEWLADTYLWLSITVLSIGGAGEQADSYRARAASIAQAIGEPLPSDVALLTQAVAEHHAGNEGAAAQHLEESARLLSRSGYRVFYSDWILRQLY